MPTGKRRYYWDSCVFISLLTGVGRTADQMEKLQQLEVLCDAGEVVIFTASITLVEVLACKMTQRQEDSFRALLQRSNVPPVSVTARIAEKAREIRDCYVRQGMNIAVPDSIHLATAVHHDATALHTYDGCGKRARRTDLLKLEVPLIGKFPLKICIPEPPPSEEPQSWQEPKLKNMNLFDAVEKDR